MPLLGPSSNCRCPVTLSTLLGVSHVTTPRTTTANAFLIVPGKMRTVPCDKSNILPIHVVVAKGSIWLFQLIIRECSRKKAHIPML